ncbi:hypothetical protein [Candidatus Thiosymbion oneisti]|nr:hypothetical protein [Candidatus Thiosymbion oneisti]
MIVGHMIARGRKWGATWKNSLALFADLLQTVAPNFDHNHFIREALERGADTADNRILSLVDRAPHIAWRKAEAARIELFLYTAPDMDPLPLIERTAAALPLVLWDQATPEDARPKAEAAFNLAGSLGFAELQDGPLVLAVARALYGPELTVEARHPWIADVLDPRCSPDMRLELLRLRIALDFGRRV